MGRTLLSLILLLPLFSMAQITVDQSLCGTDSLVIKFSHHQKAKELRAAHQIPMGIPILPSGETENHEAFTNIQKVGINYQLLDSLILRSFNTYRDELGLPHLKWSPALFRSAIQHSDYQNYFHRLGHEEEKEMTHKADDQDYYRRHQKERAEIVLFTYINNTNYNDLANQIVELWRNSPPHNAIMIDEVYKEVAFSAIIGEGCSAMINHSNLKKYNPNLLKKIKRNIPNFFKHGKQAKPVYLKATATGHFR